ncbi:phage protein, partial [[Actinobacillus] muris]
YHLARYAKIVSITDPSQSGDIADPFRPKYAVDVQLLDENNQDDKSVPVFPAVPLPVTSTASQGGDFAFPEIGTIVEIGFINGRSDKPVIRNFYPQGKTLPQVGIGEILRQQRPEVFERVDASGNMHKETDQTIREKSFNREITTDTEIKTVGQSTKHIDADSSTTVGGNKRTQVLGNIDEITASNKITGVGGDLQERVKGVISLLSQTKAEMLAPKSHVGTEGQNIFRILETTVQILADLANEVANHTHRGGSPPDQKSAFQRYKSQASSEKSKLTPIIV